MPEIPEQDSPLSEDERLIFDEAISNIGSFSDEYAKDYDKFKALEPSFLDSTKLKLAYVKGSIGNAYRSTWNRRVARIVGAFAIVGLSIAAGSSSQSTIANERDEAIVNAIAESASSFTNELMLDDIALAGTDLAEFYVANSNTFSCEAVGDELEGYFNLISTSSDTNPIRTTTYTMLPFYLQKMQQDLQNQADSHDIRTPFCEEPSPISPTQKREFDVRDESFRQAVAAYNDIGTDPSFYAHDLDHDAEEQAAHDISGRGRTSNNEVFRWEVRSLA